MRDADFLDPITADKPAGCWTLSLNPSSSCSVLRSLAWPGYFFFHEVSQQARDVVGVLPRIHRLPFLPLEKFNLRSSTGD